MITRFFSPVSTVVSEPFAGFMLARSPARRVAIDAALVLGSLGFLTGAGSLLYAHGQVRASRRQAEEAARAVRLQTGHELFARLRELRHRIASSPAAVERMKDAFGGEFGPTIEKVGGIELFYIHRDILDTLQDAYFLRREGGITDAHWRLWSNGMMRTNAQDPDFRVTFDFARKTGHVDPGFASFFEPLFEGRDPMDPLRAR